jgi:F-box interacting protein
MLVFRTVVAELLTMGSEETISKRLKMKECTISCLPDDLIERILSRLPVSTLQKCGGVCKQWYTLIRDPHFIEQHLKQAPRCALLFFPQESVSCKRYPSDAIIFDEVWSQSTMAVPVIGPDDFLSGTCNGLLCLYTKTSKIKIANFATGECLLLDKPVKYLKGDHFSYYRFGFHPVTKEYKVIHFLPKQQNYWHGTFNVIQVYTLGSEKWRDIQTPEALSLSCVKDYGVVCVDGAMFWLTEDSGASWKHAVISFDLSQETFTQIQLPADALGSFRSRRYWITEIDGKLCVATAEVNRLRPRILSSELQIWMLDSKVEQKWSHMYNLPYVRNYLAGPHFVHSDKILMQNRTGDLYSYEMFGKKYETKLSDRVKLLDFSPRKADNMQFYICVKSLVQLDAYMKVSIVHETKQREGWELKKWQAWKRENNEVEDTWKNIYELEQNSLVCCLS